MEQTKTNHLTRVIMEGVANKKRQNNIDINSSHTCSSTMATRGVFQLTKLVITYSEVGGSSRAVREYLSNGKLTAWAAAHPHIDIEVKVKNGKHPFIEADYRTKAASHQVSVKNVDNWREVESVCIMLCNRSGRKIKKITTPVLTDTPSIQGIWTPFLNLNEMPQFKVEFHQSEAEP